MRCRALSSYFLGFSIPKGTSCLEPVWDYTVGVVPFSPKYSFFTVVAMVPILLGMQALYMYSPRPQEEADLELSV